MCNVFVHADNDSDQLVLLLFEKEFFFNLVIECGRENRMHKDASDAYGCIRVHTARAEGTRFFFLILLRYIFLATAHAGVCWNAVFYGANICGHGPLTSNMHLHFSKFRLIRNAVITTAIAMQTNNCLYM